MPRTSPYQIELTYDERDRLEANARHYTSPYRDVIRAKIVLLATDGPEAEARLLAFQDQVGRPARNFEWEFTRTDLGTLLAKIHLQPYSLHNRGSVIAKYVTAIPCQSTTWSWFP